MCFGFLVIEINAKQCSGMTIKPSMKPTWECRQGKEIMVRSSQKPCANKSCYFEPFTFRYLTSKNHLHYLSILGPCLLSPPPSVIPPKSRSCFSKQTMTVCTLSLELKMFLENGKQMLHCQFVRNSREEIKLLDQWVCATTVNRTRSFTGPLYLNRKPLAGAIILPTGETITCYFVVYKFVEHRACCQAASPCITNPAPGTRAFGMLRTSLGVCVCRRGSLLKVLLRTKVSMAYLWAQQGHCLPPSLPPGGSVPNLVGDRLCGCQASFVSCHSTFFSPRDGDFWIDDCT